MLAALFRVEGYLVSDGLNIGIMVPQLRDAEGEGVMAEFSNGEERIYCVDL